MKLLLQTALLALALMPTLSAAAPAQQPIGPPVLAPAGTPACEAMAAAILTAARHDAEVEFWLQVAVLMNESAADLPAGLKEAWRERQEAIALAEEQHDARLVVCAALGHGPYDPQLRAADFTAAVDNVFHPLPVGSTYVYERMTADGLERVETTVKGQITNVGPVPCRTVDTIETLDGALVERTVEWFSQHADGTVWYFGENSQEFADGLVVSLDGAWRAGTDGAKPGILMLNAPLVGEVYRMEFLVNQAEDVARVLATGVTVVVPAGTFTDCVAIEEGSPLDADDVAVKFYAKDVGMVLEIDQQSGGRLELIQIK